jgi:archaellum component FlaC
MANKNGKMTLDKLGRMVERGFERAAVKEEVNRKLDGLNQRMDDVDNHFEAIERRLDTHESILKAMKDSFEEITRELRSGSFDLEQRVVRLEKRAGLRR